MKASRRLRRLYGPESNRLALSWGYAACDSVDPTTLWGEFWQELTSNEWRYVSLANLTYFESDSGVASVSDDVSISERRLGDLANWTGWPPETLHGTLGEDWHRSGGNHVLRGVTTVQREPDNIVLGGTGRESELSARALIALRLAGDGDIGLGTQFTARAGGHPNVLLGMSVVRRSFDTYGMGSRYQLDQARLDTAQRIYRQLADLDGMSMTSYPELRSALDRFRAACDRPSNAFADRLVDNVIALESISVASTELAYTMSARVSGLLADSDGNRLVLFKLLKSFYRVRSTIVHGGRLIDSARQTLVREPELRSIVRALLAGLLNLIESQDFKPNRLFLSDSIDEYVLDSVKRTRLRVAMATPGWVPAVSDPRSGHSYLSSQWLDAGPPSAQIWTAADAEMNRVPSTALPGGEGSA